MSKGDARREELGRDPVFLANLRAARAFYEERESTEAHKSTSSDHRTVGAAATDEAAEAQSAVAMQALIPASVTHFADEDRDLQPLCRGGKDGDMMTFFIDPTTCPDCLALFVVSAEDKRVPSPEYRERTRREVLDNPETKREIAEFREFVAAERAPVPLSRPAALFMSQDEILDQAITTLRSRYGDSATDVVSLLWLLESSSRPSPEPSGEQP